MTPNTVVVDVSFAVKWVIPEPFTAEAEALLTDWRAWGVERLAPALFAYEGANALYRKRPVPEGSAWVAANLADMLAAVTLRPPTPAMLDRAVAIAERLNRPASYDAQYAALAEAEGCEFWTADERFWHAAQPHFPWVRWVGETRASPGGAAR